MLGFDGVNGLDLIGPLEAFAHAAWLDPETGAENAGSIRHYEVSVLGLDGQAFTSESGVRFLPHLRLDEAPQLDTVIVPGGRGLREPQTCARVADWLRQCGGQVRRVASVCTGIYALAESGLLDGRHVTTHWRFAPTVAQRFPKLKVDGSALFIKDGACYTSGGVTAGIDLALALIEEDLGPQAALAVARELVVYLKRPGGQEQYSEPLRFQTRAADRFADLVAWITGHLDGDLSNEALAARVHLGPRQFARRFAAALGCTPAQFVETARMGEARHRLTLPGQTAERVADSLGFRSADGFRRAFERRFGLSPMAYRERFASSMTSISHNQD